MLRYQKCQLLRCGRIINHMTIIEGYGDVIVVNTSVTVEDVYICMCLALLTVLFTDKMSFSVVV